MTLEDFRRSLAQATAPSPLTSAVAALWWAAKGDWALAHRVVMDEPGRDAAWVHAYLHRVEGDPDNAAYWYRRAGRPVADGALDVEWELIARELLAHP